MMKMIFEPKFEKPDNKTPTEISHLMVKKIKRGTFTPSLSPAILFRALTYGEAIMNTNSSSVSD